MKRQPSKAPSALPATTLRVRVQPRASRSEIVGWRDGVLQVRLTAPPVEGAANAACIELLADTLGVPKSAISLASGAHAREKLFRIVGLSDEEARRRLPAP
ncbi:MAG TPA: DUF167 domain-containing protein [Armatimonadota bacterium]|jgi:uncharacterized protein (TIGR00251 family)|nr:DUF167 domain-containing protein [Armatimonadota bacterium]HPU00220.1 DUF167 domain-containing protein [Armatimonadota bacterium]